MNTTKALLVAASAIAFNEGFTYNAAPRMRAHCRNCGERTFSSEFCDLRCACAYKAKTRETEPKSGEQVQ